MPKQIPDTEILLQLDRMLASKRFKRAHRQSEIFRFIVESSLKGDPVNEDAIGYGIFPSTYVKDGTTIIRVLIKPLRENIRKYYANEGSEDLISIRIPDPEIDLTFTTAAGEPYKPYFSYATHNPIEEEFRLATHYLRSAKPWLFPAAARSFLRVRQLNPNHVEAAVGMVEAYCLWSLFAAKKESPRAILRRASMVSFFAVRKWPDHARVRLMRAVFYTMIGRFNYAADEFNAALKLDREVTEKSMWFAFFLLRIGREHKGFAIGKSIAESSNNDPGAWSLYAICHYFANSYRWNRQQYAMTVDKAFDLDPRFWLGNLAKILYFSEKGMALDALAHLDILQKTMHASHKREYLPGLALFSIRQAVRQGDRTNEQVREMIMEIDDYFQNHSERDEDVELAIAETSYWSPGTLDYDAHIPFMLEAVRDWDPRVYWLPKFAFFAPLQYERPYKEAFKETEEGIRKAWGMFDP